MESKHKFIKGFFAGMGVVVLVTVGIIFGTGLLTLNLSSVKEEQSSSGSEEAAAGSNKVVEKTELIQDVIEQYYLEEAESENLIQGMYKGLVRGLEDPYSVYYDKEEYISLMESSNGVYYGIGVTVSQDMVTGIVTLVKPFEGSPGLEAGILPGDILYKVGDTEVTGMDLTNVVSMIKGEEGTTVQLTIIREGISDPFDLTVERRKIEVPTVSYEMLEDQIGYIQILEFDEITTQQFITAFDQLNNQDMKGLVVDLRDNPGGMLAVVNEILDKLLPQGLIVYTEDKYGNREEYKSDEENQFEKPLAVLINGNSASASEIFAGAIKDYGLGTLVGTTTYGKGIVQRIIDLGDGTALKLTISKYFTPNGNDIHKIGIEPDVQVELDDEVKNQVSIEKAQDNQLQRAIEAVTNEMQN